MTFIRTPVRNVAGSGRIRHGRSHRNAGAVKREIEETNWAIEENEKRFNVERAADLRYKELPKLQKR